MTFEELYPMKAVMKSLVIAIKDAIRKQEIVPANDMSLDEIVISVRTNITDYPKMI